MDVFSDTTGERYLYRYRTANHFTIDEILNHYLYMTSRDQLNDLNEFKWRIDTDSENNIFRASTQEKAAWIVNGINIHGADVRKLGLDNFTRSCVENISLGPAHYEKFINAELMNLFSNIYNGIKENYDYDDVFRIACFSRKPLNATMMGHYGNNQGVIIAYDVQEIRKHYGNNALVPVTYDDKPYSYPLSKMHDLSEPGLYQSIHVGMCARKFKDWAYEEEVRFVLRNSQEIDNINHQAVLFPSVIAGVCLAPKIQKQFSNVLIHACTERKIPVFKAQERDGTYCFNAVEWSL